MASLGVHLYSRLTSKNNVSEKVELIPLKIRQFYWLIRHKSQLIGPL